MSVIELGDVGPAAPGPDRPGSGPEFHPHSWRRMAAAGVVILCLVVLAASGRPGTPMVRQVWQLRPATDYALTMRDDGVFVHQRTADGAELIAYDLATGAVRWRLPIGGEPTYVSEGATAGVLLIAGDEKLEDIELEDGGTGLVAYGGSTTAVDARSGYRLWRRTGEVLQELGDTALLGERTRDGGLVAIRLVRTRDGTTIWQRAVSGIRQVVVPPQRTTPGRVLTADAVGNVTVLRLEDGTVVGGRQLPWTRSRPNTGVETYLSEANGLLLTSRNTREESEIAAYRMDTLEQLWRIEADAYAYAQDCGPVLCVSGNTSLNALEPLTGRRVWRLPGYSGVAPVAEDRLLAAAPGQEPEHQILVEPATGRQVGPGGAGWPLHSSLDEDSVLLLHRIIGDGTAFSSVSELDLDTGRIHRIGAIDTLDAPRCSAARRLLACEQAGQVVVTAVG